MRIRWNAVAEKDVAAVYAVTRQVLWDAFAWIIDNAHLVSLVVPMLALRDKVVWDSLVTSAIRDAQTARIAAITNV